MEEIYSKIQMAEEYLHRLRIKLQASETDYKNNGRTSNIVTTTLPFLVSACASAKAAALSGGVKLP